MMFGRLSLITIILSLAIPILAQNDETTPRLIDEFGRLPSGDMKARIDGLSIEVYQQEGSRAFMIIWGTDRAAARLKRFFENYISLRAFPRSQYVVEHRKSQPELRVQFWVVPKLASIKDFRSMLDPGKKDDTSPKLHVVGPATVVKLGETMRFKLVLPSAIADKLKLEWTVNKGSIIEGQGSQEIVVLGSSATGATTTTAEVNVSGLPEGCKSRFSETGVVVGIGVHYSPLDEFGEVPSDDIKARIDNLFINLQSDPLVSATIVSYGPPEEVTRRHEIIRKHIADRNYDASRILIEYRDYEEKIRTRIWVLPDGADPSRIQ